jgi:DNA-binding PadR family transcriptional regulator
LPLSDKLRPYVVFLPTEEKDRTLSAIFGSKAAVDLLRFSLKQGVSKNIYQKDLFKKLNFSNKTIIQNLKSLTKLGILNEDMEKNEREGRIIWVKTYQLTDAGKWFALLLAEEKELTEQEKTEILQSLFRTYVKMVKGLAEEIGIDKKSLEEIFRQEMK